MNHRYKRILWFSLIVMLAPLRAILLGIEALINVMLHGSVHVDKLKKEMGAL